VLELLLATGGNGFLFSNRLFPAKRPIGRPFLAWIRVMVISSPGLNESRAQACLAISCGLLVSTTQWVSSPLSSFASNFRKQCGLAQSHSVTFPDTVTVLSLSYDAFPWCANSKVEIMNKLMAMVKIVASLRLMLKSTVSVNFGRPRVGHCCDDFDVPGRRVVTRAFERISTADSTRLWMKKLGAVGPGTSRHKFVGTMNVFGTKPSPNLRYGVSCRPDNFRIADLRTQSIPKRVVCELVTRNA
jgi:hypothetical protein